MAIDTNTIIITIRKTIQLGILLIVLSCSNSNSDQKNIKLKILNAEDFLDYKYLIYKQKNLNTFNFDDFGINNITSNLPFLNTDDIIFIQSANAIKTEINTSFSSNENLYFILINEEDQIYDIIKVENDFLITIKQINKYSETNQINSNSINIIDVANVTIDSLTVTNSSIIFSQELRSITVTNSIFNNLALNGSNATNLNIQFEEVSFTNAKIFNLYSIVNLKSSNQITDSYIFNNYNTQSQFYLDNAQLVIDKTYIANHNFLFNGIVYNLLVRDSYLTNIDQFSKNIEFSTIEITNSYMGDIRILNDALNGTFRVSHSILYNIVNYFSVDWQNIHIDNSHIESSVIQSFIDIDAPNNTSVQVNDSISVFGSNFILKSDASFFIIIYQSVQTDIYLNNSYIDFGVADPQVKILDNRDNSNFIFGNVYINNSIEEQNFDIIQ